MIYGAFFGRLCDDATDCATTSLRGLRLSCRPPGTVGRNSELGNRLFVEAVIWKFRSGAPWRDLPERFGDWKNPQALFALAASGVWESLFRTLPMIRTTNTR